MTALLTMLLMTFGPFSVSEFTTSAPEPRAPRVVAQEPSDDTWVRFSVQVKSGVSNSFTRSFGAWSNCLQRTEYQDKKLILTGTFDRSELTVERVEDGHEILRGGLYSKSIRTGDEECDKLLQAQGWFASESFPRMEFSSIPYDLEVDESISGNLVIKGQSQEVTWDVVCRQNDGPRSVLIAKVTINRCQFGLGRCGLSIIGSFVAEAIEILVVSLNTQDSVSSADAKANDPARVPTMP